MAGVTTVAIEGTRVVIEKEKKKEKYFFFIQIKNIWYYNVYIHKLKLSIKYFNLNITVTSDVPKRWVCSEGEYLIQDWVYFDSTEYI